MIKPAILFRGIDVGRGAQEDFGGRVCSTGDQAGRGAWALFLPTVPRGQLVSHGTEHRG